MAEQSPANPPAFPTVFNADINTLKVYENKTDGKYWFELIPDEKMKEKPNAWSKFISTSMADYFTIIQDQGCDPNYHDGFMNYVAAALLFLKEHNLKIRLSC